ncbi:MAG: SpoIIE family protein phosphatase [Acidobacteria bacterium]|nr:SpoIIE family protein phosphatase [Acidobacteriota bacterium]
MKASQLISRTLLWVLTACAMVSIGTKAVYSTRTTFSWASPGFHEEFRPTEGKILVAKVMPKTPAAYVGLESGDEILAQTGKPFTSFTEYSQFRRQSQHRGVLPLMIRKPTGKLTSCLIDLPTTTFEGFLSYQFGFYLVLLIIPVLCTIIGLGVCWLRWEDKTARMGGLFFVCAASLFGMNTLLVPDGLREFYLLYNGIAMWLSGYLCFHFFSEFPTPTALSREYRWVRHLYLLFTLGMLSFSVVTDLAAQYSFSLARELTQYAFASFEQIQGPVLLLGFLGSPLTALPGIRGVWMADQERRFRVLWLGIAVGCGPLLALFLVDLVVHHEMTLRNFPHWLTLIAVALYAVFPLTFGYTIVKHRVLGVRQILRRSIQYAFLSKSYWILELVLLVLILRYPVTDTSQYLFTTFEISPSPMMWRGIYYCLAGIGLFSMWQVNPHLQALIDRAFFRDAYNAQQVLTELSRSVRNFTDAVEVLQRVGSQINAALHVNRVAFFVHQTFLQAKPQSDPIQEGMPGFVCRFEMGSVGGSDPDLQLPTWSPILQKLSKDPVPLDIYFADPDSWTEELDRDPEGSYIARHLEQNLFETLNTSLIVPLATKEGVLGLMSLGPKLSEEPYTKEDKSLLMAVAEATALRLENARLIALATEEAKLKRELEIARHLQQSLLPSGDPVFPDLQLASFSTTAQEVGGDYYDYFVLNQTELAIAIGDVTGHGVSSGLLMALAKGGLLNQVSVDASPSAVIAAMNTLICITSNKRNLMTFAYAVLNVETWQLQFANAGHPFPFHYSASTRSVRMIESTAYPLGVRPQSCYEMKQAELAPGDTIVFYSDGLVEARDSQSQVFGYDGLEKVISTHSNLDAHHLRDRIFDAVRSFSDGHSMDDDITLVILKRALT